LAYFKLLVQYVCEKYEDTQAMTVMVAGILDEHIIHLAYYCHAVRIVGWRPAYKPKLNHGLENRP